LNAKDILVAIEAEIARLQQARELLTGGQSKAQRATGTRRGTMSAAGRASVSAAQKKRWAAIRKTARS
jgi:hypothetical protein